MASSVMELQLGYSGFCPPHTLIQTQTKCAHDLYSPCGVSHVFIFTLRLQHIRTWRNLGYFDHGINSKIPNGGPHASINIAQVQRSPTTNHSSFLKLLYFVVIRQVLANSSFKLCTMYFLCCLIFLLLLVQYTVAFVLFCFVLLWELINPSFIIIIIIYFFNVRK